MAGEIAGYIGALVILLIGLITALRPKSYARFLRWQMKVMWAAELKTTQKTESRLQFMGMLLSLLAVFIIYTIYSLS